MFYKRFLVVALLAALTWTVSAVQAQNETETPKTLVGQLDQWRRQWVGGAVPSKQSKNSSIEARQTPSADQPAGVGYAKIGSSPKQSASSKPVSMAAKPRYESQSQRNATSGQTANSRETGSENSGTKTDKKSLGNTFDPTVMEASPMGQRISRFRQSPFDSEASKPTVSVAATSPMTSSVKTPVNTPVGEAAPSTDAPVQEEPTPTKTEPILDKYDLPNPPPITEPQPGQPSTPLDTKQPASEPSESDQMSRPEETNPAPSKSDEISGETPDVSANGLPSQTKPSSSEMSEELVLVERESPVLKVHTLGPRKIAIGKEAALEVHIKNIGTVPAEGVMVEINLPVWAELMAADPTTGATRADPFDKQGLRLKWQVGTLGQHDHQKVVLRIVPRENKPIDLAVHWNFQPASTQAVIEVQQPQLALVLDGAPEVFYGQEEPFKLKITNSGNGPAEKMILTLMPLCPEDGKPSEHSLGNLAAGATKTIDLAITARQQSHVQVEASLRCDGPTKAQLCEKLLVRKAEIQLEVTGPQMQFLNTTAPYRLRLKNIGNTSAENLVVKTQLPPEIQFQNASHEGRFVKKTGDVIWNLPKLEADAETILELQGTLTKEGTCRLAFSVDETKSHTRLSAELATRIESIADLTMEVIDPAGPVQIGENAFYEIRIYNRGSKQATGVEAVAYFSQGIEPTRVQGMPHKLGPGQVVFDAIESIDPGKEVVLKVRAKAETAGNHMFRAEVYCQSLGTKLIGEETTRFYKGGLVAGQPQPVETSRQMRATGQPILSNSTSAAPTVAPRTASTVPTVATPRPARSDHGPIAETADRRNGLLPHRPFSNQPSLAPIRTPVGISPGTVQ